MTITARELEVLTLGKPAAPSPRYFEERLAEIRKLSPCRCCGAPWYGKHFSWCRGESRQGDVNG
jgi:hypothetical protein